ncbi:MAG: hypothetical protein IMHGJWDQ_000858 [Candidatus Fervidibacter sp.]
MAWSGKGSPLTGDFLRPSMQRLLQEWGVPVLHKPFRLDELRMLLKELPSERH